MRDALIELFDLLRTKENLVDVTYLKHILYHAQVHLHNPTLFKAINELSRGSDFCQKWTKE